MSKLDNFADRAPSIISRLEARAEQTDKRLSDLETRGNAVFDRWEQHATNQDKAISAAEDAINRLSNGAPPLSDLPPDGPEKPAGESAPVSPIQQPPGGAASPGPFPAATGQ